MNEQEKFEVLRPSDFECCYNNSCSIRSTATSCEVSIGGRLIYLPDVVIAAADAYGVPPQILMAQAVTEAALRTRPGVPGVVEPNPYSYRYEVDTDFESWVGDGTGGSGVHDGTNRHLLNILKAGPTLGVDSNAGSIEFMPCESPIGTGCTSRDSPTMTSISAELRPIGALPTATWELWDISAIPLSPIPFLYLRVDLTDSVMGALPQVFIGNPAAATMEYRVDGVASEVVFGSQLSSVSTLSISASSRTPNSLPTETIAAWGSAIPNPTALASQIRNENATTLDTVLLPPAVPATAIQTWTSGLGTNPVAGTQSTNRYGEVFRGNDYYSLVLDDPSYDVQGQWFIAASFGLFQQKPESVRTAIYGPAIPSALRAALTTLYDPRTDSPAKLFEPAVSVEFSGLLLGNSNVRPELDPVVPPETACPGTPTMPNQCTWELFWKRKLRTYNLGSDAEFSWLTYDEDVMSNLPIFVPIH
jgi:hypothetical protein